jgi:hypothetical protein
VAGVTPNQVTDGMSNVLLIGEKLMNLSSLGQPQLDDDQGYTAGWDIDVNRTTSFPPESDYRGPLVGSAEFNSSYEQDPNVDRLFKFGSSHTAVVNFVLADGSVKPISFDIDASVFAQLGNKSDNAPLSQDWGG